MAVVTAITIFKYFLRHCEGLKLPEFMAMWYGMEQSERLEWMENYESLVGAK